MGHFNNILPKTLREPIVPTELRDEFAFEITLSNCRRLKTISWLLLFAMTAYMVADYLTIKRAAIPNRDTLWAGIMIMRTFAMASCGVFIWLFGPLRNREDIKPMHTWLWQIFTFFALIYTSMIVSFMFPIKESLAPIYIFLIGPSTFLAMNPRQALTLLLIGLFAIIGWLHLFAPASTVVQYHVINACILSCASLALAQATYISAFRAFMNKQVIEQKNLQLEKARTIAENASQSKSDFLASISHEIRTPMNAILGMTEIALHTHLSSEQRDYIESSRESALHLLDIINDILDYSHIEARGLRLISAHFDLPVVIHSAAKTIQLQAEQKGVALDIEIMSDTPRFLKGDPGRLRQILINLLSNAIKFTEEGSIRLTAGPWSPSTNEDARPLGLLFSVKDTGPGVPKGKLQSIFQAFSQVDGSSSRSYGGSGLGLTICKNLIEAMGGSIHVESQSGNGSEFVFTTRFHEGDEMRATEADVMSASWNVPLPIKPSRVLLVDDNPLNVKVERLHLDRMGMDITVAESGNEALMCLVKDDFDLVLMDLEMPGMDGYETTHRIRMGKGIGGSIKNTNIPILAVTAHALAGVRQQCKKTGMNGFVTKPASFGDLGTAIREILGGDWHDTPNQKTLTPETAPVLDLIFAGTNLGISQAEIRHLVPNAMVEIDLKANLTERAIGTKTLREVAIQTHTLKSVAASIGAEATRRAAVRLENASRRDDMELCQKRMVQLRHEVKRLVIAVKAL